MSYRIMVVDDEPGVLTLFKSTVEPLGFEVTTMVDSREASLCIERQKFDGFFLDARMPAPDGFELTRQIRASRRNAQVPIVMLTGHDDVETMRQGFQAGATFFIGKPFSLERMRGLFSALRSAMLVEKRRSVRLPFSASVICRFRQREFKSLCANISEGGILLDSSGGLSVGNVAELEFRMPADREALRVRARVVRREPPDRLGLQFLELPPEALKKIRDYVVGIVKG